MKVVYFSPSTQEHNVGKGSYGTEESRMNHICDLIIERVKSYITVIRNSPKMTLQEIVADSNKQPVDMHLALHSNAAGINANGTAKGTEVLIYKRGGAAERFANCIYSALSILTPWNDRGVVVNAGLYELNSTKAEAVLVEIDFHDNPDVAEWIIRNEQMIAETIAAGILNYFGIIPPVDKVSQLIAENTALKTQLSSIAALKDENEKMRIKLSKIAELLK